MLLRHLRRLTLVREELYTVLQSQFCVQQLCLTRSFADDTNPWRKKMSHPEQTERRRLGLFRSDDILSNLVAIKDEIGGSDIVHAVSAMDAKCRYHQIHKRERQNVFEKLFSIVEEHKKNLTGREALQIITILQNEDHPQIGSSYRSLLIHILQHVDDLYIQDCNKLMYFITQKREKIRDTSLTEQLHNAIVKKVETGLSTVVDLDIKFLRYALYIMTHFPDQQKYQRLIKTIQDRLCFYPGKISNEHATSIFRSLAHLRFLSSSSKSLLARVQNELIEQSSSSSEHQIKRIFANIRSRIEVDRDYSFYNEKLSDALIEQVIDADMGYNVSIPLAVIHAHFLYHKNQRLMNYCCASFFEKTSQKLSREDMGLLLSLINALGRTDCKPIFLDEIRSYINDSREMLCLSHDGLVTLAENLLILDCFPTHLLKKIFDNSFKSSDYKAVPWRFCRIYQKLKSNPSYTGPMPTQSQLANLECEIMQRSKQINRGELLPSYLNEVISDPRCIRSKISTRLFHLIDNVVAFHEDGTPAPITNESYTDDLFEDTFEYLEDLRAPPGCRMILIVVMPRHYYTRNTKELLGARRMFLETLEAIYKHPLVVINGWTWDDLREDERTSFIMNEIRSKLRDPIVQQKYV